MAPTAQSAHRVLLVDNDDAVRAMMTRALELKGFEVVAAANATDALRCIVTGCFDVLLTDLHIPNPTDWSCGSYGDAPLPTGCGDDAGQRLPRRAKRHGRRLPGGERNHRKTIRDLAAYRTGRRKNDQSHT